MEVMPKSPLLHVTKEDIEFTRNSFGIYDANRIKETVDLLLEWMEKQDHLAECSKHISRGFIERIFLLAKASTESAKMKIEKILTTRAAMPEMCFHRTPGEFDRLLTCIRIVFMPKVTPKDRIRVSIIQVINKNVDDFSLLEFCRFMSMIGDYRMHYDYSAGDRMILDLGGASFISKMNPVIMRKSDMLGEAYTSSIKGIHILNAPAYMDAMLSLIKSTVRSKVLNRLHIHNSYEELHEHIDKEILPEDFGGNEMSIAKLAEKWQEHLRSPEIVKLIADQEKIKSDESKRSSTNGNTDAMGMPGSFRKLCVD